MKALRVSAPGKINLCLLLGPTRDDGRHELVTVYESLSLADSVRAEILPAGEADQVICPDVPGPNLAGAALERLRSAGWSGPPLRLVIEKRVPVAAGMGGGSADAAAALRLAAALVPVERALLSEVAAGLGADVPAQVRPGAWLGTGAGELLEPVPQPPRHELLIVPSRQTLATPAVYAEADRLGLGRPRGELEAGAARLRGRTIAAGELVNDLEPAALSLCPEVEGTLDALRDAGADRALICGSGPTAAGIWWERSIPPEVLARLRERFPQARVCRPVDETFAAPEPA